MNAHFRYLLPVIGALLLLGNLGVAAPTPQLQAKRQRAANAPSIRSISPTHGGADTLVTITGHGFGEGSIEDVTVELQGAGGLSFLVRSRNQTTIVAEVPSLSTGAGPGRIVVTRGRGATVFPAPYAGVTFPTGVYAWTSAADDANTQAISDQVFVPESGLGAQSGGIELRFAYRDSGMVCVDMLDTWCEDDVAAYQFKFLRDQDYYKVLALNINMGTDTSPAVRGSALEYSINSAFSAIGGACTATFDAVANRICISCSDGPITYLGHDSLLYVVTGCAHTWQPQWDDGTIDGPFWGTGSPTTALDYVSVNLGTPSASVNGITEVQVAVVDLGGNSMFPEVGVSKSNRTLDPTGATPDIGSPLDLVAPFTFESGTWATTSAQYIRHPVSVPKVMLDGDIHVWVQFPAGATHLWVGLDGDSLDQGRSFFSFDGYQTKGIPISGNLGLRVITN